MTTPLTQYYTELDAYQNTDPARTEHGDLTCSKALAYSLTMSDMAQRFCPEASHALALAIRYQHIGRWNYPRADFPEGRTGYLTWRKSLYTVHANLAAELITQISGDTKLAQEVATIIAEKVSQREGDSQALEDVACLVFLQNSLAGFIEKYPSEKLNAIILKTWNKMSPRAQKWSANLAFTPNEQQALENALQ